MERDSYCRKLDFELPEFEPEEDPIFRVIRGEDGIEREVEDTLVPRLIFLQSMETNPRHTVDELIAMHDKIDTTTIRRIFRKEGIAYELLSISEQYAVGEQSVVRALDGPRIGRNLYVDIKRGAKYHVYAATRAQQYFENFADEY